MSIETVLKKWIGDYSGITDVIQMPFNGIRPTNDHIGFQIIGFSYSDFDDSNRVAKDSKYITYSYKNNASLLLSINAYGKKAYSALNALRMSINNWQSVRLLNTENMSLNTVDSVNNIADFEDASFRNHWQGNFNFNIVITNALDIDRINSWMLGGKWRPYLGSEYIVSADNEIIVSSDNELIFSTATEPDLVSTIKYP